VAHGLWRANLTNLRLSGTGGELSTRIQHTLLSLG
jgi:hypothetical protein